ncbi:MAG TPA: polyketide synthase, partial [Blastocatellia bacterium]|nr:polyketide synthase [Blastocatellia bacterium]
MTEPSEHRREIAVIGLACRFPGAQNSDQFWANLRDGVESISRFTDEELLASGIAPEVLRLPNYVKAGGVLPGIELFDAGFFGMSRREAEMTDPQQRVFLEVAWEGLENAGYDPQRYNGSIGVFAGSSISTYLLFNLVPDVGIVGSGEHFPTLIGNDKDYLATHVSYKLNLHGPSMSIQTACSTSLVAIHTACQSLLNGECDIAIAGGVAISVPQQTGYFYQEGAYFSPDGSCRSFSAGARGTVFGSGAGVVVLKRLEDALRDGDCIDAIVKGSAINNDGATKVGFTAPSVEGQARAISEALA